MKTQARPSIGQTVSFRGGIATIVKVHSFGTIDVETVDGNRYRITGLAFI